MLILFFRIFFSLFLIFSEKPQDQSSSSPSVQPCSYQSLLFFLIYLFNLFFVLSSVPSPCIGASPLTKIVYPRDKTKYIQCRDEFHYEIFTCPNGGEYNEK